MKTLLKYLCSVVLLLTVFAHDAGAVGLSGTINVNQTSDTAAKAKINATNYARRQILSNVLSQYSDKNSLNDLMQSATDDDLMNLVSETIVSDEHISSTAYSANIRINIDNDAAKRWLNANGVRNWISDADAVEKFTALMVVSNGISDWAELKRIARSVGVEIETQNIIGNQIIVKLPLGYRTKFTAAVREAGWRYADNNGVLNIWK